MTVDSLEGHCDVEQFKLKAVDSQPKALYFLHQHHCGVKNIVNGVTAWSLQQTHCCRGKHFVKAETGIWVCQRYLQLSPFHAKVDECRLQTS